MQNSLGPRGLDGLLSETFGVYWRNLWGMLLITAIVAGSSTVLSFVLGATAGVADSMLDKQIFTWIAYALTYTAMMVFYPLMFGALIHAVSEQYLRQTVDFRQSYRFAWNKFGSMLGAYLLVALITTGLFVTVVGIPLAIYFGVRWSFVLPVTLLEELGPRAALSRSSELVKENWWRVWGILLLVGLIASGLGLVLGLVTFFAFMIGAIAALPISTVASTLLYFDLRVRKEGYNLETLAAELRR